MDTLILKGEKAYSYGAELINKGEIVAFPTETVYGLGADCFNTSAVLKIFEAKGRPQDNPLIVHISKKEQIFDLVKPFSETVDKLINRFMPGPITIIFKKSDKVPNMVTANLDTVGIRMPKSAEARAFIDACKTPIAAPSANRSTHISTTTYKHVYEEMQGLIPLIIQGEDCEVGIESTILDMTSEIPTILRPGAITATMLLEVLKEVKTFEGVVKVALAPGMKYKHYAPQAEMLVVTNCDIANEIYKQKLAEGATPVILCFESNMDKYNNKQIISLGKDTKEACKNIYSAMFEADKIGNYILCEDLSKDELGKSIMNRVLKASGGKIK
ncbi:MAG: L-threonylcarbamoyladenylate synthase [Clostridia bacterium]